MVAGFKASRAVAQASRKTQTLPEAWGLGEARVAPAAPLRLELRHAAAAHLADGRGLGERQLERAQLSAMSFQGFQRAG